MPKAEEKKPRKNGQKKGFVPGYFDDIAKEIKKDANRMRKRESSDGAPCGVIKTTQTVIDACFLDYCGGLAIPAIALRKGIAEGTIRSWSRRYLWTARKKHLETENKAKIILENARKSGGKGVPRDQSIEHLEQRQISEYARLQSLPFDESQFRGKAKGELAELYEEEIGIMAMRFVHSTKRLSDDALLSNAAKIKALNEVARQALGLEDKKPSHIINIGLLSGGLPPTIPLPPAVPILSESTAETALNLSDSEPLP